MANQSITNQFLTQGLIKFPLQVCNQFVHMHPISKMPMSTLKMTATLLGKEHQEKPDEEHTQNFKSKQKERRNKLFII